MNIENLKSENEALKAMVRALEVRNKVLETQNKSMNDSHSDCEDLIGKLMSRVAELTEKFQFNVLRLQAIDNGSVDDRSMIYLNDKWYEVRQIPDDIANSDVASRVE